MEISQKTIHISSIVVVGMLLVLVLYSPRLKKISSCNTEIADIKKVVEELEKINNNPKEFNIKKDKVIKKMDLIKEKVPLHPMISQVIEQITKPVKQLEISLVSITPVESIDKRADIGDYIETPIELSLQSDYKQFGIYLNRLRHLPRLVIIKSFAIQKNTESSNKLDIKLIMSVFHYGKD